MFQEGFHRESILVDQQVLDFEPGNEESLVRSAEAHLRLYEPLEAQQRLSGVARDVAKPRYLRVQALYHSLIGEHAEAIAICRRVLSQDPSDLQMRLSNDVSSLNDSRIHSATLGVPSAESWPQCGQSSCILAKPFR